MNEWKTEITSIKKNEILVRGYAIEEIMGNLTFSETIFLILKGELPTPEEGRIFDAMLASSIDHGPTPPSVLATLNATSTGAPLNAAVASGILAINSFHGGAIEDCMKLLKSVAEKTGSRADKELVFAFVKEKLDAKYKFPGFGHRVHSEDPRSTRLKTIALNNLSEDRKLYFELADMIVEAIYEIKETSLPINVDGMIGIVLLTMGFVPQMANGIFMISRVPGLLAHYIEEKTTQKPMRTIDQKAAVYSGPERRKIERG